MVSILPSVIITTAQGRKILKDDCPIEQQDIQDAFDGLNEELGDWQDLPTRAYPDIKMAIRAGFAARDKGEFALMFFPRRY